MALSPTNQVVSDDIASDRQSNLWNRISWGAIFAGVAVALVTQLLLNMLGVGVGAASIDIGQGADNSGTGFSIGAGIWWALSGIIAAFVGGLTAGRLAGAAGIDTGRWHGLVAWAATTLVVIYLLTSAVGGLVGGAFNVIGGIASTATKAAGSATSGIAGAAGGSDGLQREARQLVDPNGAQTVQDSVMAYIRASVSGDKAAAQAAQARAVDGLAKSANIPPEEARARLGQAEAQARQAAESAKQTAMRAADKTRSAIATASILGFIALLLGAAAAWFGGASGTRLHERIGINRQRR